MKYLSKRAAGVAPYVAGEQPQDQRYIKLNTNENPYSPSPMVDDVLRFARVDSLRKYPDPDCTALRAALAKAHGVQPDNVFCGNGSDEVLAFCFPAFFDQGDRIAFADITYSFYRVYAQFFGVDVDVVPLKDFRLEPTDYYGYGGKGILVANPNAPTATAVSCEEIQNIVQQNRNKIVIVDEAYADFCQCSAVSLTACYDNLLVVKTFSKSYALAGARIGFAIGDVGLIDALNRVKNSFNSYTLDAISQQVGIAAISDEVYFKAQVAKVVATRNRLVASLAARGYRVLPSDANFVFVEVGTAKDFYNKLKKMGVLVRFFDKPMLDRFLRVSVGTDEEMDAFVAALDQIAASNN